jgi:hypothetical protein
VRFPSVGITGDGRSAITIAAAGMTYLTDRLARRLSHKTLKLDGDYSRSGTPAHSHLCRSGMYPHASTSLLRTAYRTRPAVEWMLSLRMAAARCVSVVFMLRFNIALTPLLL